MPYLTPDTIPEDTVCYRLNIPNDVAWVGIVKGALSELIKAYNFEQYGSVSPADTAQRFIDMYDEFVFQECDMGCCYDTVESRATSDGLLQIRVNGGDWQQDPRDPRLTGGSLPPPVMDETHSKCDAATNGEQHLSDFISAYSEALGASASIVILVGEIAALIVAILIAPEAIPLLLPLLFAAASAAFSLGQTAWDAYFTSDVHDDILCALFCNIGEDGQFTDEQFAGFIADLTANMPASVAKDTFINSVIAMGKKGINNQCAYGSSADADCSSCVCGDCALDAWAPYSEAHGSVTIIDDTTLELTGALIEGFGYYCIIVTPDDDTCCFVVSTETVSGEVTGGDFCNQCGSAVNLSTPEATILNKCVRMIEYVSVSPFVVRVVLGACP